MMTSSNGNIFRVTGHLCSEFTGALMFYLICAWMNGWVKNREAGDLRCHRAHYDVTVMESSSLGVLLSSSLSNKSCKSTKIRVRVIFKLFVTQHICNSKFWRQLTLRLLRHFMVYQDSWNPQPQAQFKSNEHRTTLDRECLMLLIHSFLRNVAVVKS